MMSIERIHVPLLALTVAVVIELSFRAGLNRTLLYLAPSKFMREQLKAKFQNDEQFRRQCGDRSIAFLHALVVCLPSLLESWRYVHYSDNYEAWITLGDVVGVLSMGYFLWDSCICFFYYKLYGLSFLIHGIMSLAALAIQLCSSKGRLTGLMALILSTEVSTPFLHLRWMFLDMKETSNLIFKLVNAFFMGTFIVFRLIYVPFFILNLFAGDLIYGKAVMTDVAPLRLYTIFIMSILWMILNYQWGVLFSLGTLRAWRRAKIAKKSD